MLSKKVDFICVFISFLFLIYSGLVFALPTGSYLKTCYSCNVTFNQLSCICKDKQQFPTPTSLSNIDSCPYIQNSNGQLRCLPPGSYFSSCHSCRMVGNYLTCNCQSTNQIEIPSSLANAMYCNNIINQDGRLVCSGGYRHHIYTLPPGNYSETCAHCHYNGQRLSCRCQKSNGSWRHTSLNQANTCQHIQNIDGTLQCSMLNN